MAGRKITWEEAKQRVDEIRRSAEERRNRDADREFRESVVTCTWKYDNEYDTWDTECGHAYCQMDGTLTENEYKYCPACGGLIAEATGLEK
jgi:nitrite reductase/ring-hydroxylating ferredoxin subunit